MPLRFSYYSALTGLRHAPDQEFSVYPSIVRLGFCVIYLLFKRCHSRMFLAGIYDE